MEDLKQKTASGVIWKFAERISAQLVTFVVSVILARLLEPSDYGAIALVTVFITIANVFVSSGFGNALIQKANCTSADFSSVFYFNFLFSWGIYAVIFLCAPFISEFYAMPVLCPALRVLALRVPLAAINSVQQAYVSRYMIFRKFFWSTLIGTVFSAAVGISLAYSGFGVWALVAQYLSNTCIDTLVLWITVKWRPTKEFSAVSLKELIRFGWKILCADLLTSFCNQIRSILIGKFYTSSDLAYYNKGTQYPSLIITNVDSSISTVLYAAMCRLHDNPAAQKKYLCKSISLSSFIVAPMMTGLYVIAEDMVTWMLTDKWLFCVPYIRLACATQIFYPLTIAQRQAIKATGRSDIFLKQEVVKRILSLTLIFLMLHQGVWMLAATDFIVMIAAIVINGYPLTKLLYCSYIEQWKAILPNIIRAFVMGVLVWLLLQKVHEIVSSAFLCMLTGISFGIVIYFVICICTKSDDFYYLLHWVKQKLPI